MTLMPFFRSNVSKGGTMGVVLLGDDLKAPCTMVDKTLVFEFQCLSAKAEIGPDI